MIPVTETQEIAISVQDIINILSKTFVNSIDHYVTAPLSRVNAKRMAAVRIAEHLLKLKTGKHPAISEHKLPDERYLSWLIVSPLNIAYDSKRARGCFESKEIQISRAIFHEIGHVYATPELLTGARGDVINGIEFTRAATPQQEEKAWIWAMFFIGLQMGHYANSCRNHHNGYDDTAIMCTEGQATKYSVNIEVANNTPEDNAPEDKFKKGKEKAEELGNIVKNKDNLDNHPSELPPIIQQ